jgi:hypothetical protein
MASVGKLAALLTLDTLQFESGLQRAEQRAAAAKTQMSRNLSGVADGGILGKVAGSGQDGLLGKLLPGGMGPAALGSQVGQVIANTVHMLEENENRMIERFKETSKLARTLGTDTGSARAFQLLGGGNEAFITGLRKLEEGIGTVQQGSDEYARKLERIGVNAKDLIGLPLDEQYKRVAQAIAELSTNTERAAAAHELLGRAGSEALPQIIRGAAGYDAAAAAVKRYGLDLDKATQERIKEITLAEKQSQMASEGLSNAIGRRWSEAKDALGGQTIRDTFTVLKSELADVFNQTGEHQTFEGLRQEREEWLKMQEDGKRNVPNEAQVKFNESIDKTIESLKQQRDLLARQYGGPLFAARFAAERAGATFKPQDEEKLRQSELSNLSNRAAIVLQELNRDFETMGASPIDKKIAELTRELEQLEAVNSPLAGSIHDSLTGLQALSDKVTDFNRAQEDAARSYEYITRLADQTATPLEKFSKNLAELEREVGPGSALFTRGVSNFVEQLGRSLGLAEERRPQAAVAGSQDFFRLVNNSRDSSVDQLARIRAILEAAQLQQSQMDQVSRDQLAALKQVLAKFPQVVSIK